MEHVVAWYVAKIVSEENTFTLKGQRWGRLKEQMGDRISGPKRQEAMGGSGKLNNEEPRNLQSSSNIVTVITSRRVVWISTWHALWRWEFYRESYWKLTYLLTPWSRVLLEKLASLQLVKKFPAFYGTRRFLTALECFLIGGFLRRGVVSTSPNPQPGGPGHPF